MTKSSKMKALIIDHDDSFIWNIKAWLSPFFEVKILNHTQLRASQIIDSKDYDLIVLSPGPKSPLDYNESLNFLNQSNSQQPILGICLGWQMMVQVTSGQVTPYQPVYHGKTSILISENSEINLKTVARYHSLITIPNSDFNILAYSETDHHVMWAKSNLKKWMGFQFHPESFLTKDPLFFLNYLLDWIKT